MCQRASSNLRWKLKGTLLFPFAKRKPPLPTRLCTAVILPKLPLGLVPNAARFQDTSTPRTGQRTPHLQEASSGSCSHSPDLRSRNTQCAHTRKSINLPSYRVTSEFSQICLSPDTKYLDGHNQPLSSLFSCSIWISLPVPANPSTDSAYNHSLTFLSPISCLNG